MTERLVGLSLSSNPARELTPMSWMEILTLTVGIALIVTMICSGQRA